ncbi:MAG: beta strand repeat-containing protein, partial [Planctomycetota bacterium]
MNLLRTSSQKRLFRSVIVYFLTFCMFFNISLPVVLAGPEGAQVVNGNVSIQQSGYNTTITASDQAIINYSSFDISRPEIVQFIQPGTSASVLNRILSVNPTNINGTLLANGRVFFVNPAGVYFGNGAQVNVNQLVASALNITDADFMNGRYNFVGGEGSVINAGDITAEKVYLIGQQVANFGSISCPAGYVVMASGDRVFLGEPGSDIVLEIDGASLPESADPIEGSGVLNEGTVEAADGTIILAAAGDIYSQAISNVGSLSVSTQTGDGGQVELTANGGQITNSGTINASGDNGGSVTIDGGNVALSSDSVIHADAVDEGDGGEVLIYADNLDIDGVVTAAGNDGYILFDPDTLDIDQAAADTIEGSLVGTATVDVAADITINLDGEIDSSAQVNNHTLNFKDDNANNDLTINLNNKITLGSNQTLTGDGTVINVASAGLIQNGIDVAATTTSATVTVSDGTYTEDLTVDKSNLTLKSVNGRDSTTIQLVDGVGIDIDSGGSGFTLGGAASEGFEITSGGATTFEIQLKNAPSNVEISHNRIVTTGNASMGISVGAAGATELNVNNNIFTAGDLGDGSIWGPDMVDVSVTNNTFTGPAVKALSGYAVEFAGVTGNSFIQDNIISNYGMGIAIFNGTGTSDLTISGNQISDSTNGIRLGQYSPGVNGDMTTVTVTENTLSNNTIGLRINDGANVKASNFTIRNNSFLGNTTGLANQHTSESVTAEQNYWGDVDGPSGIGPGSGDPITEVLADSVDYSPWWGGDYIGDSHVTAWIWGTDDSIQDAIDLASTTVSDGIYITSGIYTEAVNVNKQLDGLYFRGDGSVASEIDGTLTLSDAVASNTGVDIYTQNNGELTLNTVSDTGTHSLLVDTVDGTLSLDEDVTANGGVTLDGGIINVGNDAGDKVTSNGIVSIVGGGTVTIDAAIDPTTVTITSGAGASVNINNSVTADTQITVTADDDVTFSASGDLGTTSGSITVTADADGDDNGAGGAITMADGTVIDAGSGTITLAADENIAIGRMVTTNNTVGAVSITSTSGAVTDAGDTGGEDIEAIGASAIVTIDAVTGVGNGDAIETEVTTVDIDNSTSGNIEIDETDALNINKIAQATAGNIDVVADGTITVVAAQSGVSAVGAGTVDLDADG